MWSCSRPGYRNQGLDTRRETIAPPHARCDAACPAHALPRARAAR